MALSVLIANGCSSTGGLVTNKLDPRTSVMITYNRSPMIFYRDVSGRAAHARDYVYLAPIEVNRSGSFRHYLWLGIWSTLDDSRPGQSRDGFESIVVFADGEPLPLEVSGWTPEAIGASEPVYMKPVASAADAYYEVTLDQLRLIAEANDVRLQSGGSRIETYEPWDHQQPARSGLREFLNSSRYQ
jgi:hypothetical protein